MFGGRSNEFVSSVCKTALFQVPEEAFRVFNRSGLLFQVRTARRSAPYLVPAFSTSLPAPPLPSPPGAEHMHTGKERCSRWPGLRWRQAVRSGAASAVLRRPRLPAGGCCHPAAAARLWLGRDSRDPPTRPCGLEEDKGLTRLIVRPGNWESKRRAPSAASRLRSRLLMFEGLFAVPGTERDRGCGIAGEMRSKEDG